MGVSKTYLKKVISTSGDSIEQQKVMYKKLYINEFVQKPFSKNQLINALHNLESKKDK